MVTLADKADVPLASEQKELTPFQRMVLTKEFERRQEKIEEEREKNQQQTGDIRNSHSKAPTKPGAPMGGGGEAVEYVNKGAIEDG